MTATGGHSDSMPLDELRRLKTEDYGVTVDRVRPKMMREWNHGTDTQRGSWRDHGGPGGYVDHLRAQIKTNGITEPIEIGHRPDGRATIYDGTHRALIAHELGIDPVPVRHFQMVRGQHYGKLAVQEPPEGLTFQHREEETGGSKFPTKIHLDAVHPEHGVMGTLRYYPPKRSNGRILVDKLEVNPEHQRRGVGSALMDEMQRRHPNASIDHGSRTNDGRAWWSGYAGDKDVRRGRTASAPGASRKDVADRVLGDSVLSRQSDLLSSELIGGAGLYAAGLRHGPNRQVTHDDGRAIAPDDELTLYHETSAERAAHLRQHGTSQSKPVGARTVDNDYEPGRGMGKGLYLMHSPHAAGGVFGDTVLPVRVRAGDLAVPPERAHRIPHGMTPLRSLMIGDGYTEAELPHHAFGEPIRRQASTRQGDRSTCPCGTPVEFDSIDGWQHRDGSVSHDGDFYGKSVSDLMRTSVLGPITPASGTIAGSHLPYDATYQAAGETHYLHREPRGVHARTGEGRLSGFLNWDSQGQVGSVQVQPEYRRHGLASALWEHAKVAEPDLHHSTTLSSDGAAWARHTSAGQRNWGTFWHGTPSGDLRGGAYGLHVGSQEAARQALESRIGFRADGKDWDGTQEYGKTLLAGRSNLLGRERGQNLLTGHNARGLPEHDHYPHERAEKPKFGSGNEVQPHHRPALFPVRITGEMSNTPESAHDDFKANSLMKGQITRGNARRGYFYRNQGEDDGSISAVLPGPGHVERVDHHSGARFVPDKRVFTHTDGLDHRLFDGEHLRPEVRSYVLGTITTWWAGEYRDWSKWARVYFAGSEASEWTSQTLEGNDDFDVLVGVDYDGCRTANPQLAGLSNQQITDEMNAGFRPHNGPVMITVDGILTGPWDRTSFVNVDSHDIRRIKPYAAYDVGADAWVVKPPHLPHWSLSELPKPVQQVLRAADSYARHVLKLAEPERTQQGAALFEAWHSDRSRAFSDRGEGWWDIANLREKWGDQSGWWAELVACKRRADQGLDKAPEDWSNIPTGYRTAALEPLRRVRVPLTDLVTDRSAMEEVIRSGRRSETPDKPVLLYPREDMPGKYEIGDGHHRVNEAIQRGETHVDGFAEHGPDDEPYEGPFYDFSKHMKTAAFEWDELWCTACSGSGEKDGGYCPDCGGTGKRADQDPTIVPKYAVFTGQQRECPCGMMARFHREDRWRHLDGSTSHDDGESVSDKMCCTACSGTGEQGTGHECYQCDGTGLRSEQDPTIDNANPENGLPVGRDDSKGIKPVTAATDKWPPYLTERPGEDGYPTPVNVSRSNPRGPVGTEEEAKAAGLVGPFFHGTTKRRAQDIRRNGFRQPRVHNWEMANAGTAEEVDMGHTHRTFFAEKHEDAHHFAQANHGDQVDVVKAYLHPDHIERDSGGGWMPSVQVRDVAHAMAINDRPRRRTAKLPKTQKCDYCKQQATKRVLHAEGMAYIPVCDGHESRAKDEVGEDYCNTKLIPKTATGALVLHLCTEGTPAHRIASMAGDPDQLMPHQAAVYRAQSAMTNSGKDLYHYMDHNQVREMGRVVLSEQGHPHGDKLLLSHSNPGKSYVKYDSDNGWPRIGLAPNHLHSHAVFHELAHILTNGDHESTSDEEAHGPAFVHTFRHLLDSYSSSAARQVFDEHYRPPSTHEPRMGSWPQVVREESQIRPISDFSDDKIRAGDHSSWSSFHRLVDRGGSGRQRVDEIKRTLQSGSPLHRPIEVQQQPDGSEHVGDGHHRIRALQELGWTKIPVTVKHMAHTGSQSQSATLYHWAPQAAREDIAEHGLDHRRAPGFDPAAQGPRGVFMHHSEGLARDWVPDIERTHDLYEVKASGLKLHPDPYDTGDASYTEHPVPPDRLRRLTSARRSPHHGEGPWFHGSNADLKPGDTLKPGDAVGEKSHGRYSDGTKVWISNDVGRASAYGHRTYEVEPHSRPRSPYANHDEHHTTGATVLREVDHRGQLILQREAAGQRLISRDRLPVPGYDPEQMGPENPHARFSLEKLDLRRVRDLTPGSGAAHDEASSFDDNYYKRVERKLRSGRERPLIATEHPDGSIELHDGWHRGSIALHHGITEYPAYVHRPDPIQTTAIAQIWITPQLVMGSAAGLNHARAVNSASEAQGAISEGLTAVLPAGSWFIARQALQALGMPLLDVTQRLRQLGAPA